MTPDALVEDRFYHIRQHIAAGSLLVYNNTRVIQARLVFHKADHIECGQHIAGARIEVFCLEPLAPRDYALSLSSTDGSQGITWRCMVGNLKKWKEGRLALTLDNDLTLYAERLSTTGNTHEIKFTWETPLAPLGTEKRPEWSFRIEWGQGKGVLISFAEILDRLGQLPIPPYLNRETEESDLRTYQTVYSRIKGSVAAPTAGLHFTDAVLADLRAHDISTTELTLHVGAGTFQPVKTEDANQHTMHTEVISVPLSTLRDLLHSIGKIVAVGTTSMRTLESLYYLAEMLPDDHRSLTQDELCVPQFAPYEGTHTLTTEEALSRLIRYLEVTGQDTLHASTQIMIKPGYSFHVVDQLITNFHQPKSTLLLLVSAFLGNNEQGEERWHDVYRYALDHDFRFLSYGDSSILTRKR